MRELTKLFRDVEDVGKGQKKAEKFERLFESGIPKIAKKVGEEGVEIAVAAMSPKGRKKNRRPRECRSSVLPVRLVGRTRDHRRKDKRGTG